MVRIALIGFLTLFLICMVPFMEAGHPVSSHSHHGTMTTSCATCAGPISLIGAVFLLTMLGLSAWIRPSAIPSAPVRKMFHPPRALTANPF